jgi:hypothetical protein
MIRSQLRDRIGPPARVAAIGLVALLAAACSVVGAGDLPTPTDPPPSPVPTQAPGGDPTTPPSPTPDVPGPVIVDLDIADEHDVSVYVDNDTGYPIRVSSGRAGDGMSVRWFDAEVVNVDESTLRVTWVGLPRDEQVRLTVSFDNGPLLLAFDQDAPPANSDATGYDRVLVLSFDTPVSADEVIFTFTQGA